MSLAAPGWETLTPVTTGAERERYARRLRFPAGMEQRFRADFYRQILPGLRVALWLVVLIVGVQGLVGFYGARHPASVALASSLGRAAPFLLALHLTRRPGFQRWWQAYFVGLIVALVPVAMVVLGRLVADNPYFRDPGARLSYLTTVTLYGMLLWTGMLRMQFVWTAICHVTLVAATFWGALTQLRLPAPDLFVSYVGLVLPALTILLYGSYSYERAQRTAFLSNHLLELERARSEALLRNTLPDPIVDRLMASPDPIADDHMEVTVLFADIVDFTPWSSGKPAREVLQLLSEVFSRFDRLVAAHRLEKIKTIGDCYMVVAGAPLPRADHVEAAARLALAMQAEAERLDRECGVPLQFRMGLHTGPLVAGVIGEKRFLYDVWGDTVNTASRLETQGLPGAIQVSSEVARRLQSRFELRPRGEIALKGKGRVESYFLEGETSQPESRPDASGPGNPANIAE